MPQRPMMQQQQPQQPMAAQRPPMPQQQQQMPDPNAPLSAAALAAAPPGMQKQMLGTKLYPRVAKYQPELAGKVTGMMLEMDNSELLILIESEPQLKNKVDEALRVLEPPLPLPSIRKTMSRVSLHCITSIPAGTSQRFMLHFLYCRRLLLHLSGHFPSPSGCFCTNLTRLRVPPSQSLEHHDHFVHSVRSQSASHA